MNFKNTIAVLSNDISEVKNLVDGFVRKDTISTIEIDLSLEKLRKIYDMLLLLKEGGQPVSEMKYQHTAPDEKKEIQQKEPAPAPTIVPDEIQEPVPTPIIQVNVENTMETSQEEITEKVEKIKPTVLGEKAGVSKTFFNESFSHKHPANDFSIRQQSKPVADLNKAIGINDKFLFINELFDGDSQQYKMAIEYVNSSANFNDAFAYINDNYKWDMENEHAQKLLELIKRKFISGKNV